MENKAGSVFFWLSIIFLWFHIISTKKTAKKTGQSMLFPLLSTRWEQLAVIPDQWRMGPDQLLEKYSVMKIFVLIKWGKMEKLCEAETIKYFSKKRVKLIY